MISCLLPLTIRQRYGIGQVCLSVTVRNQTVVNGFEFDETIRMMVGWLVLVGV